MDPSEMDRLRVHLPLGPEDSMEDLRRLLPALFPPAATTLRRLFVCRPIQLDLYVPDLAYELPEVPRLELEAQMAAAEQSRRAAQPLADMGYRVESDVVTGHPVEQLLSDAELWKADLSVVRAQSSRASGQRLGAIATALLHHSTRPVVLHRGVPHGYRIRRILIPTDFSPSARVAADWGLALAEAARAEAHLLYVLPSERRISGLDEGKLFEAANREMRRWREALDPAFARPVTDVHVTSAPAPADGVLRKIEELNADLVVLSTLGRSAAMTALLGSNARRIARESDRPVFVLPAQNRLAPGVFLKKLRPASALVA